VYHQFCGRSGITAIEFGFEEVDDSGGGTLADLDNGLTRCAADNEELACRKHHHA
jgi:hypothetical protein